MKNTWRILAAVTALSLAACPGGDDDGDGDTGTGGGNCTGTFSGALTGTVQSCTVTASKIAANGQLLYNIVVEPKAGSGTAKRVDDIIITLMGDPAKGTFTGSDIREATGTVYSTDQEKPYDLSIGFGQDLGTASLTIDSIPAGQDEGADTYYEGFGGKAQIRFDASPIYAHTGSVNLSLDFKP